jgi:hypothetical protein
MKALSDDFYEKRNLLKTALSAAVPLRIQELLQRGGPDADDIRQARAFANELGAHGDDLLFRSKKKGRSAAIFNKLARVLAVLAFCPGGVKLCGEHWQAHVEGVVQL